MTSQRCCGFRAPSHGGIAEPTSLNGATVPPTEVRQNQYPSGSFAWIGVMKSAGLGLSEPAAGPSPAPSAPWHGAQLALKRSLPFARLSGVGWSGSFSGANCAGGSGRAALGCVGYLLFPTTAGPVDGAVDTDAVGPVGCAGG